MHKLIQVNMIFSPLPERIQAGMKDVQVISFPFLIKDRKKYHLRNYPVYYRQ